ncbi:MAG: AAA family ATPase [bacterium]
MRLESLKIQGFKSFADKVELVFKPGITAIVGPNGCGKSNITDAIRWVLGEQSAKSLRGGQMEDVIFNGSACRPPKGMAEVSLKLANLGSLPIAFPEVVITRRIFRSGENEYLINKNQVRLKDIVDMFLDTGLGKGAYSIVEQGRIDFIIMAKPKERRFLIESAAGILKYKSKREEALKKMEATEQNLERLKDIIYEVEKQKDTLSRQAELARAYKECRSQEEELIRKIALGQYFLLQKQKGELEGDFKNWKDKEVSVITDLTQAETEIEGTKVSLLECEEKISSLQKSVYSLESQINSLSQQRQSCEKDLVRLEEERANIGLEREDLQKSQVKIESGLAALEEELKEKEKNLEEKKEGLKGFEIECSALQKRIQEKSHLYETRRKDILGLTNQEARLENLCGNLRGKQRELVGRQEGLKKTLSRLEEDLQTKEEKKRSLKMLIEQQKESLAQVRQQETELSAHLGKRAGELKETEQKVRALEKKFQSERSRLHSLEEIFDRKEGYQDSVRHLLLARKKNQKETAGLLGVIAELIAVPPDYEKAIEAALEDSIQCMVVNTFEDGLILLSYLQGQKVGRGTFIALGNAQSKGAQQVAVTEQDTTEEQEAVTEHVAMTEQAMPEQAVTEQVDMVEKELQSLDIPGVIGAAVRLIRYEERYQSIISHFFGSTILVEDLAVARQVFEKLAHGGQYGQYRVVTQKGEVLTSCGGKQQPLKIISGGGEKGSMSFLTRKRQVEELRLSVPLLQSEIEKEESSKNQINREIEQLRREKESLTQKYHTFEIALNGLQKDLLHLDTGLEQDRQRVKEVTYKKERALADEHELAADLKNQEERLKKVKEEKKEAEQQSGIFSQQLDTLRQEERALQDRRLEAKVSLTSLQEHQKALKASIHHHKESQFQNSKRIEILQSRLEKISLDREKAGQTLCDLQSRLPELKTSRNTASQELGKLEAFRTERVEQVKAAEKKMKKSYQLRNQVVMEIKKIELHLTEIHIRMSHVLQDSHLPVSNDGHLILPNSDRIPEGSRLKLPDGYFISDDGHLILAGKGNSHLNEGEIKELQVKLQKVRAQISALGAVNLMAIEEYQDLLERCKFLHQQEADMRTSLDSLHALIAKINQDSCVRFKQAFDSINLNFQTAFKRLFEGGHAELLLEDPNDLLETGVEVVAQPPGKKPQYLSLLSGGEKAMTAIALILAIYLLKPSPFCLLDEIDAPLDDANVDRFLNILHEFKERTQFLIITHSKKTMQMADAIYGVTIEQPGLSKIVSLELNNCEAGGD